MRLEISPFEFTNEKIPVGHQYMNISLKTIIYEFLEKLGVQCRFSINIGSGDWAGSGMDPPKSKHYIIEVDLEHP